MTVVIDSSALVAFCLNEKGLDKEKMKNLLLVGVISTYLIGPESANAILVSKSRGLVNTKAERDALASMLELLKNNVKMIDVSQTEVISEAYDLAELNNTAVYDAMYLSLAKKTRSSLVSKDPGQILIARKIGIIIEEV